MVAGSTRCGTTPHKPQIGAHEELGHSPDQDAVYDICESSVPNSISYILHSFQTSKSPVPRYADGSSRLIDSLVCPRKIDCAIGTSYEPADQQAPIALAGAQAIVSINRMCWLRQHRALAVPIIMASLPSLRSNRHLLLDTYLRNTISALPRCKRIQEARLNSTGLRC